MKRVKDKNGFTLIELLAVVIILGVIMTMAIPNIIATLDKNKRDSFIKDAKRAITSAEYTMRANQNYEWPDTHTAVVLPLKDLDNLDLEVSPFDVEYSLEASFVAITNEVISGGSDTEKKYYVHLVACTDEKCENLEDNSVSKNVGINLIEGSKLDESGRYDLVVKGDEVVTDYLRDTTGSYQGIKQAFAQLLKNNTITNIVVY